MTRNETNGEASATAEARAQQIKLSGHETITIGRSMMGRPAFAYHDTDCRPCWKKYGTGTAMIEFSFEPSGALHIEAFETPETGRGGKEVWSSMPKEAVAALVEFLQTSGAETIKETIHFEGGRPVKAQAGKAS